MRELKNIVMNDEEVLNMPNFEEIMENTKNRINNLENIHRRLGARSAVMGAHLNVKINASSLKDIAFKEQILKEAH